MRKTPEFREELERILLEHAGRYPLMEPTDAVKLIYQNEFGGGHLIRDREACMNALRREYEGVEKDRAVLPYESIGNGIVRVNLARVAPEDVERLGAAFILSAAEQTGTREKFLEKLELLRKLTARGHFKFSPEELEAYLDDYQKAGYPPVSHSGIYREAYHPAYRIIRKPGEITE